MVTQTLTHYLGQLDTMSRSVFSHPSPIYFFPPQEFSPIWTGN